MSWFRLKACPKCRGGLATDEGDLLCLQCCTYYYKGLYGDKGLSVTKHPNLASEAPGNTGNEAPSKVEQGGRSVPDKPPDDQKKGLEWRLGTGPALSGPETRLAADATVHDLALGQR